MTSYERRVAATEKTKARFEGKPFAWGKYDCLRMAYFHARNMGKRPPAPAKYHSAMTAKIALSKRGVANLTDLLDGLFKRITPAQAWAGDLVMMPGEAPFGALAVSVGNGRVLAYHEDLPGAGIVQPTLPLAAWRL